MNRTEYQHLRSSILQKVADAEDRRQLAEKEIERLEEDLAALDRVWMMLGHPPEPGAEDEVEETVIELVKRFISEAKPDEKFTSTELREWIGSKYPTLAVTLSDSAISKALARLHIIGAIHRLIPSAGRRPAVYVRS